MSASGKPIYLMGDFNINLLRSAHAQNFIFSMQSFTLMPTTDKPTRVHNDPATLIDNIFVGKLENNFTSGNIVSDISDHYSQFFITHSNVKAKTNLANKHLIRDYSKFSESNFVNDLFRTGLNHAVDLSENDINKSLSTSYNKLNTVIKNHAPLKKISKRKAKQLTKAWITKGIRKSIKIKNIRF